VRDLSQWFSRVSRRVWLTDISHCSEAMFAIKIFFDCHPSRRPEKILDVSPPSCLLAGPQDTPVQVSSRVSEFDRGGWGVATERPGCQCWLE